MAMQMTPINDDSISHSMNSGEESDHLEVHHTFKYRGKTWGRWKRLVKINSLLYFLISAVCIAYLFVLSSTRHWHNMAVGFLCILASMWGLSTGFSFHNPSSFKIYLNSVITGLSSMVTWIYTLIILIYMVLVSIDQKYEQQYNNFDIQEVNIVNTESFLLLFN